MLLFRGCSSLVIRCFKRVEHFADWLTGAAGPVFIFLCWSLIGLGGLAFYDVVARDFSLLATLLLSPILTLVPLNMYLQYYLVTHIPPGFPSPRAITLNPHGPITSPRDRWLSLERGSIWRPERWGFKKRGGERLLTEYTDVPNGREQGKRVRRCRKCDGPKPERTHHCSVCKRCVLMMDHHCPWINACVGLHNQRHFVLFMAWLSAGCWSVCAMGYSKFWDTFTFNGYWPGYTPKIMFTLTYILCLAIGVAVPVLLSWHLLMISRNETSIESHDNDYLQGKAKNEGLIYLNPYDLGRRRNLELFFNVGSSGYSKWTLLFPLIVPPSSNGWSFPRQSLPDDHELHEHQTDGLHAPELAAGLVSPNGAENGHARKKYVMGDDGSLTDDEEGGGGWMDD